VHSTASYWLQYFIPSEFRWTVTICTPSFARARVNSLAISASTELYLYSWHRSTVAVISSSGYFPCDWTFSRKKASIAASVRSATPDGWSSTDHTTPANLSVLDSLGKLALL
jgi:hypothetical protein